jgi:hypothetical protein
VGLQLRVVFEKRDVCCAVLWASTTNVIEAKVQGGRDTESYLNTSGYRRGGPMSNNRQQ